MEELSQSPLFGAGFCTSGRGDTHSGALFPALHFKYLRLVMKIEHTAPGARGPVAPVAEAAWWGRIGFLWLLLVPLCVGVQTLLLPIGPNDFWYHARAGRFIVENGFIPRENLFTQSEPWVTRATPFLYQSWIAEILLFVLLRAGSLSAIIWARSACMVLAFGLLALAGCSARAWFRSIAGAFCLGTQQPKLRAAEVCGRWR